MHKLMRYIKGYEKQALLAPLFKMLEACFELFVPLVVAQIVDVGIKNQEAGYILKMGLDENGEIIGYEYVNMGVFMDAVKKGVNAEEALNNAKKTYGRYADAVKYIDPRHE